MNDTVGSIIHPMSKIGKLLTRMRENPRDWRVEEIKVIATRFGVDVRKNRWQSLRFFASRFRTSGDYTIQSTHRAYLHHPVSCPA
uniref:Uncharacterized protein n=1 Tax=Candidatus Kentrum sp. DK TaxID=2126562 RepID=A0A450SWE2_9GAMM|nr:MAG: hypothetical protein BECKDK2373C_GA0170839_106413 [Candidatus Kentron sp. DK]